MIVPISGSIDRSSGLFGDQLETPASVVHGRPTTEATDQSDYPHRARGFLIQVTVQLSADHDRPHAMLTR
jgi:hypothetical protein